LTDFSRFDSVYCSWRYFQTIGEAWESILIGLENISQSVLFQLYLMVLESVITSSDSTTISTQIVVWSEPVKVSSSTAQMITESWIACEVKARLMTEVPVLVRY
jgi:hypothetical protein